MALTFSLVLTPVILSVGASVDYARAVALAETVRSAADQAALGSVSADLSVVATTATAIVEAAMGSVGVPYTSQISTGSGNTVTVSITATMATSLMSSWVPSIAITKSSTAGGSGAAGSSSSAGGADNSCVFSLGETLTISTDTMTFNGSPSVNLAGCSLRSNKSMKCNGSSTYATSYAVGSIVGCSDPHPGQAVVPDIYAGLASNISKVCGAEVGGVTWTASGAGALPSGANVKSVERSGFTEIHVCGTLTLNGTNATTLTGSAPSIDTVVVVENGNIQLANGAYVNSSRVTFILAGGADSSVVAWPNGNGGNAATWNVSASIGDANPWKGIALYQSPSVTTGVDMSWGSGTTLAVDGVAYFPNAQLTESGQVTYGPTGCSKLVVGEFTLNGAVNLKQSAAGCAGMQVTQYSTISSTSTQGSAYLLQ